MNSVFPLDKKDNLLIFRYVSGSKLLSRSKKKAAKAF